QVLHAGELQAAGQLRRGLDGPAEVEAHGQDQQRLPRLHLPAEQPGEVAVSRLLQGRGDLAQGGPLAVEDGGRGAAPGGGAGPLARLLQGGDQQPALVGEAVAEALDDVLGPLADHLPQGERRERAEDGHAQLPWGGTTLWRMRRPPTSSSNHSEPAGMLNDTV